MTKLLGKRVSLIGVLQPDVSFDAAYRIASITSKEHIEILDRQADLAADLFLIMVLSGLVANKTLRAS